MNHPARDRGKVLFFAAAAVVLVLSAVSVFAHAKLESSEPKAGEILTVKPGRVALSFSVAIQPSMSSIMVTDSSGKRVDRETVSGSDGNKVLSVELGELWPGRYRVDWRALSADDHMIRGELSFELREPAAMQEAPVEQQPMMMDHSQMDHSMHEPPAEINWLQSLIRWLMYVAMLALAGAFVFRLFVVGPAISEFSSAASEENTAAALGEQERRFLSVALASSLLVIFAGVAALVFQSSVIFETGLMESVSPSQLQRLISETSFGPPWALQMSWAVAALLFVVLMRAGRRGPLIWLGLTASAIILLTPSLTGHARAAYNDYSFAIISDWLHLMAAAVWVGGLIQIAVTVPAMMKVVDDSRRALLLSAVISNFNKIAMAATVLIVITGLYNSWIHVESFSALFDSTYGLTLLIKIGISCLMIVLGGLNAFVIHPRIRGFIKANEAPEETVPKEVSRFHQSVRIEIALAIIVLLLAAILAFLPPAREHSMPAQMRDSGTEVRILG